MRKSCAPSLKNKIKSVFNVKSNAQALDVGIRRPLLTKCSNEALVEIQETTKLLTSDKIIYSVVWSKRTTKKHKTWEGDGTLEIKSKAAILKDLAGNILGSSNSIKIDEIQEGARLIVGSKEVEIQEKINEIIYEKSKVDNKVQDCEPKEKKRKSSSVFTPNLHLSAPPKLSKISVSDQDNHESLFLPAPDYSHQWKYNEEKREITDVKVCSTLAKHLRPHQRIGVTFLYECLLGMRNVDFFGAILADEMGLGKTFQCLTVCHTLLKQGPYGGERIIQRVLVVTPSSLTETWNKEISKWLGTLRMFAYVVDSKNKIQNYSKQSHVPFVIVSYEMLISNYTEFEGMEFDLLICDEGHRLKNSSIKASICLRQLNIKRKIILSGTPIQNDLQEFYSLIDFVNSGILGEYQEYKHLYENPIVRSQSADATNQEKELGAERASELNLITSKFVLRRTQAINTEYLPKKREYIVFVRPSELQQFLLRKALEWYEVKEENIGRECSPLQIITILKKICSHPSLIKTTKNECSLVKYLIKLLPDWNEMGPFDSGKLELVENFLQEVAPLKEKVVLVSNHTKTLDMLSGLCDHLNLKTLRLDGNTQSSERNSIVEKFNRSNTDFKIFLLSSKAGGVGLNLSGASRLILYDNDWNPATDLQAMSRIWRDGQKNDVKIYRFITAGTIEEKIFQRQIAKTTLGGCVINQADSSSGMKFSDQELKDLFTVQDDFESCATHNYLNCGCDGSGELPKEDNLKKDDDPFKIVLTQSETNHSELQMYELKKWEHRKYRIDSSFLEEACLATAAENVIFIFSNQTEIKV